LRADGVTENGISGHATFLPPKKVTEVTYRTQEIIPVKLPFFGSFVLIKRMTKQNSFSLFTAYQILRSERIKFAFFKAQKIPLFYNRGSKVKI
jgi:hypothetical protein